MINLPQRWCSAYRLWRVIPIFAVAPLVSLKVSVVFLLFHVLVVDTLTEVHYRKKLTMNFSANRTEHFTVIEIDFENMPVWSPNFVRDTLSQCDCEPIHDSYELKNNQAIMPKSYNYRDSALKRLHRNISNVSSARPSRNGTRHQEPFPIWPLSFTTDFTHKCPHAWYFKYPSTEHWKGCQ